MMSLTPAERIDAYRRAFPRYPPLYLARGRIEGLWIMGNQYQTSGYHGAYPQGYLRRVMSLFPDAARVMHLFSGSLPPGPYVRVDIRPEMRPDVVADAMRLSSAFRPGSFDLILADPPYTAEDADHYGTPMVSRNIVLAECMTLLAPGGWVVWLDQVLPNFRRDRARLGMAIGMVKSTNHRVRGVFGFVRPGAR